MAALNAEAQKPEKTCGTCSLCCKLLDIHELEKPAGVWCQHARPGKGCAIHGHHPGVCQAFRCWWLDEPQAADNWKPEKCGFLIREAEKHLMIIDVEASRADSWKREPYYGQIKRWSKSAQTGEGLVTVRCNGRVTVVFPEADLDIGAAPTTEDALTVGYVLHNGQRRPVARVARADGTETRVVG